jgi:hypothetical protein
MIPIRTSTPPRPEDADQNTSFQTLVERWLVGNAFATLNRRHVKGDPPLISGNMRHIQKLAIFMNAVAAHQFSGVSTDYDTDRGRASSYRLSLDKIYASNERRAEWVLKHWDPSKVEGRSRGGKHGKHDGVRKGPSPRWTYADVLPYWDLPPRQRRAATLAGTGMSSARFDQLKIGMDDYLARRQARDQARAVLQQDLDGLLP